MFGDEPGKPRLRAYSAGAADPGCLEEYTSVYIPGGWCRAFDGWRRGRQPIRIPGGHTVAGELATERVLRAAAGQGNGEQIVIETSNDSHVTKLIQAHAEVVSKFIENGPAEVRRNRPVP